MRTKIVGNKRDNVIVVVKNSEATSSITSGMPVELSLNGTNDGLAVLLPSNSDAKAHAGFFGVALGTITAGNFGECAVFGFILDALVLSRTRAATTDSWSTVASMPVGCLLNVDTVNNWFSTSGGTQAKSAFLPYAILAESIASTIGLASSTDNALTASSIALNIFLRAM